MFDKRFVIEGDDSRGPFVLDEFLKGLSDPVDESVSTDSGLGTRSFFFAVIFLRGPDGSGLDEAESTGFGLPERTSLGSGDCLCDTGAFVSDTSESTSFAIGGSIFFVSKDVTFDPLTSGFLSASEGLFWDETVGKSGVDDSESDFFVFERRVGIDLGSFVRDKFIFESSTSDSDESELADRCFGRFGLGAGDFEFDLPSSFFPVVEFRGGDFEVDLRVSFGFQR